MYDTPYRHAEHVYIDDDENIIETIKQPIFLFPRVSRRFNHIIGVITTRDYLLNLTRKSQKLRNLLRRYVLYLKQGYAFP